ncbi:MAG: DUF6198 family protein [Clostridia bacterium]|nr:DUF6198 family protein [Clostridia bacterium]
MKKITVHSEIVYLLSIVILALAVAILSAADFGVSMVVAPAYILSQATGFLSFGQAEYVIQAVLFIIFCLVVRKFKWVYLSSFLTCLIYGAVLDLWRLIPFFNPAVTAPGSMELWLRIVMFIVGELLTAFSIALCFKTYLYPQVYDFFVKGVSEKFKLKRHVFKTCFDLGFLAIGTAMTLLIFGKFVGVWFGTLVIALVNGTIIGLFGKLIDKFFTVKPFFPKLETKFEILS